MHYAHLDNVQFLNKYLSLIIKKQKNVWAVHLQLVFVYLLPSLLSFFFLKKKKDKLKASESGRTVENSMLSW